MNPIIDAKMGGWSPCYQTHPPLPLGEYSIYGGNAADPVLKDADIYVTLEHGVSCNLTKVRLDAHKSDLPADAPESGTIIEVSFRIVDGHVPGDVVRFNNLVKWLCNQLRKGKKIHIGCIGGHGRTGTVLAAIAVEFLYEKDAIRYVREQYCQRAIETTTQVNFLQEHYSVSAVRPGNGLSKASFRHASNLQSDPSHHLNPEPVPNIYRQYLGKLQKKGSGYVARCPFHEDHRPSLRIDNNKGLWLWYCDPCGEGGSISRLQERMQSNQALAYNTEAGKSEPDHPMQPLGEHVEDYDYRKVDGSLAFQTRRFESVDSVGKRSKTFRQRRPDGSGGWCNNVPAEMRLIYNLPEVVKAENVLICEGEKDCNTAISLGFTATCNPMGANKWQHQYSLSLQNKNVIIVPDNDEPGERHGKEIFDSLKTYAKSVKIVRLPDAKDLTEWVEHEGTAEQLQGLIDATPIENLSVASIVKEHPQSFAKTDSGNAERFAAEHHDAVRYCSGTDKWYVWDGTRWVKDDIGQVYRLAKMTVRGIQTQAIELTDDDQRRALTKHALQSESEPRINAMLSLAEKELGIPIRLVDMDRDPMLLNILNGTLDLRTGKLLEHCRSNLITKIAPIEYDPSASCPSWLKFVSEVTSDNNAKYLQRAVGYSLTGETVEHAFFFLFGTGANGKTTFLEVLRHLLGDYAQSTDFSTVVVSPRSSGPRNDLAKLHGARLVTAAESEDGVRLSEAFVKQITGGDTVEARFLYGEFFEFTPQFKLWLASNHRPVIRGTDEGIWRRIKVVDFKLQLPNAQRDRYLGKKLREEAAGIFNWALEGLAKYRELGLMEPEEITISTTEYRKEQDVIGHFVDACCICEDSVSTSARELYEAYTHWANETQERVINERQFSNALASRGFAKSRLAAGTIWKGVGIKDHATLAQGYSPGGTSVGSAASVANSQNFAELL